MDEGFSAPSAIDVNLEEEDKNIDFIPPKIFSEEEHKIKEEQNEVTLGNNNEENKEEKINEEHEEEGVEEEKQRPLESSSNNKIGCQRIFVQSIEFILIYGFAIWGLILQNQIWD